MGDNIKSLNKLQVATGLKSSKFRISTKYGRGVRIGSRNEAAERAASFQEQIVNAPTVFEAKKGERKTTLAKNLARQELDAVSIREQRRRNNSLNRAAKEIIQELPEISPNRVTIGLFSFEQLMALSKVVITKVSTSPADTANTLFDKRLGSIDQVEVCSTCSTTLCPGHFGHIPLVEESLGHSGLDPFMPIINPLFHRIVIAVMNCICWSCGKLRVSKEIVGPAVMKLKGKARLDEYEKKSKDLFCNNEVIVEVMDINTGQIITQRRECDGKVNKKINLKASKDKNYLVVENGEILDTEFIFNVLDLISDIDSLTLGFSPNGHPRDLLFRAIPVPPTIARQPELRGETYQNNSINGLYRSIINTRFKSNRTDRDKGNDIYKILDKLFSGSVDSSGLNKHHGYLTMLSGKKGLFRKHIMGKPVNFSLRAVLGIKIDRDGDKRLRYGEIGLPYESASYFRVPMLVTAQNIKSILARLEAGRISIHIPAKGENAGLSMAVKPNQMIEIKEGDTVERWAEDGDMVIFNRQPSIHQYSMLSFYVKFLPHHTIRMHPSSTIPFNADFDGDSGTVLHPRDPKSLLEMEHLMSATKNLIDNKDGRPLVGLIMDCITSSYLLTQSNRIIDEIIFDDTIESIGRPIDLDDLRARGARYGIHPYSGKLLFSALFPRDFSYTRQNARGEDVVIIDGILFSGRITSTDVGVTHRSIIQELVHLYGDDMAVQFITEATWMLIDWLDTFGFTLGPQDCEIGENIKIKMKRIYKEIDKEIAILGPIPNQRTDPILYQAHEKKVISILNRSKVEANKLIDEYVSTLDTADDEHINSIFTMAKETGAGTKGEKFNLQQLVLGVGQQIFGNKRLCPNSPSDTRLMATQPHRNPQFEPPPSERGFCKSSFTEGLDFDEIFMSSMGGRYGIYSTNMRTPEIGALNRITSSSLIGIIIITGGKIGTINGNIYQFTYGGDGLNPSKKLKVKTSTKGDVNSFIDVGAISEFLNSKGGYIKKKYADQIENNRSVLNALEHKLQEKAEQKKEFVPVTFDDNYPVQGAYNETDLINYTLVTSKSSGESSLSR